MRKSLTQFALASALIAAGAFGFSALASASTATSPTTTSHAPTALHAKSNAVKAATSSLAEGQTLFDENCSSCHGLDAAGSSLGPSLLGRGAATVDLWVSSGWMPLAVSTAQPSRAPDRFTRSQTVAIADYVGSLKAGGFSISSGDIAGANITDGQELFSENCAGCHTITGAGDALSGGYNAPSLHGLNPRLIAEAIETAPGDMPHFYPGALTSAQVKDVVAYVYKYIDHPTNPGGLGLGGNGPVAEGFIGLFIGVGACLLFALWIGDRSEDEDEEGKTDSLKEAHV